MNIIISDLKSIIAEIEAGPRKINQKDYIFYVVVDNKIQSGWEYVEDAKEMLEDLPSGKKGKVYKKVGLKKLGLNPDNNEDWEKVIGVVANKEKEVFGDVCGARIAKDMALYIEKVFKHKNTPLKFKRSQTPKSYVYNWYVPKNPKKRLLLIYDYKKFKLYFSITDPDKKNITVILAAFKKEKKYLYHPTFDHIWSLFKKVWFKKVPFTIRMYYNLK